MKFSISTLLILTTAVAVLLFVFSTFSPRDIFQFLTFLLILVCPAAWWILTRPDRDADTRLTGAMAIAFVSSVLIALAFFDLLISIATTGAMARGMRLYASWSRLGRSELAVCCYSVGALLLSVTIGLSCSNDFFSNDYFADDVSLACQICLIVLSASTWLHIRIFSARTEPFDYMPKLATVTWWIGMIFAIAGISGFCILLVEKNIGAGLMSLVFLIIGSIAATVVAGAMAVELVSTPSPKIRRLVYGHVVGLAYITAHLYLN